MIRRHLYRIQPPQMPYWQLSPRHPPAHALRRQATFGL